MPVRSAIYLVLQEMRRRSDRGGLGFYYPDEGGLRRELYPKHIELLNAGAHYNERVALGGNRVGKTESIGGYETALHLTGEYPPWWEGHVYTKPILAWACGVKSAKVRDVNQEKLLGALKRVDGRTVASGIGRRSGRASLIPAQRVVRLTRKTGVADAVDQAVIRHKSGWDNVVTFKGYEEGALAFASEAVDWIWLDEEPPHAIYDECVMRLLTTEGHLMTTLTPIEGMTETMLKLLEDTDII